MPIDDAVLQEIRQKADLGTLIGSHVALRKRGADLVGLCPFHAERTPSLHVHPEQGYFKCFGCGAGGNAISFVQRIENLPFPEAVRVLAQRLGIALREETPQSSRRRSEREAIYEANGIAARFYHELLLRDPSAQFARDYCTQRDIRPESIERFVLGFAPERWDALSAELQRNGIEQEIGVKAGLLKQGQHGYYDFYRGRLMIPTYSTTGEVIAFGGRALGDAEPKYLNTSATPVHQKGRHLFALNLARRAAAESGELIVVEGYLDCIALHQAGFGNAVASLGTSFTAEQAAELRRYAQHMYLCFDADVAGRKAALRAIDVAVNVIENAGSRVRIVVLPAGQDPDSVVRSGGREAFAKALAEAMPSIEFKLNPELDRLRNGFDSPSTIARQAEELIRSMTPREEWDRWRVFVAARLKVNVDDLRNSRFFANSANFGRRAAGRTSAGSATLSLAGPSFERDVVLIVSDEPALAAEFSAAIGPERFSNEIYRRIYRRIAEHADALGGAADVFTFFAADDEATQTLLGLRSERSGTVRYPDSAARREHMERIAVRLREEDERRKMFELDRQIDELLASGKTVPEELRENFANLVARLKG